MANLSIRVPEELRRKLDYEASASRRPRSELVRVAISEYVTPRERERELAELERAAQAMATASDDRRPGAQEFLEVDWEALELADRAPSDQNRARR